MRDKKFLLAFVIMRIVYLLFVSSTFCFAQEKFPHPNAHAHNDYEHDRPLRDALQSGFTSVEADVHLHQGKLRVGHTLVTRHSRDLESLYLTPLDSIMKANRGRIYPNYQNPFYLMIDIKTSGEATYAAICEVLKNHASLLCEASHCAVKIFLSGNRPVETMLKEGYKGIGIDGRPEDLGKGYSTEMMPVISDNYNKWSEWDAKSAPATKDLNRIRKLAEDVHKEGKRLRLWAIPDNETAWKALQEAGVDIINTDHLKELDAFLSPIGK
jgi:hypothetical protein